MTIELTGEDTDSLFETFTVWSERDQIDIAQEECAELITALSHFKRGRLDRDELAGEIADVFIMVSQLDILVGGTTVQDLINFKMKRLRGRIKDVKDAQKIQLS